jgi:alcohol dehydrogenase class IV
MSSHTMFTVQTRVVSGVGSLHVLPAELARLGARRVAVIADRGVAHVGLLETVLAGVDPGTVVVRCLVDADPGVDVVEEAAGEARRANVDVVLAVGGGSALAVGKAVAIRVTNDERVEKYEGLTQVPHAPIPTVAVPTTAGSGSEVSKVLVVHQEGRTVDLSLRIEGSQPRTAILDATVLRSVPRSPMLYAGLDALSHSIESLWSRGASMFTRALAVSAGEIILDTLPIALEGAENGKNLSGANDDLLQRLLDASCAANMACGNSSMGLVHALAAAPDVRIPHGLSNGILMPYVASFNEPALAPDAKKLVSRLGALYEQIGFVPRFEPGSVGDAEVEAMIVATAGHPFRKNNVREATDDDLRKILLSAGASSEGN